jgi:L-threonylcarbamoyladenylate synthase
MTTTIGTNIALAAQILTSNNLVAIPTETVYGLAANALNDSAVIKIYQAKQRPHYNPLIIHVAAVACIEKYAVLNDISYQLAKAFMPGALTLLLPKKDCISDLVTAGSSKVAIRVPNHKITLELLSLLDFPLAAPSANVFGYVSPVTATHVYEGLHNKVDYILDGGICDIGLESTIVEVDNNNVFVHRVGGVSIENIEAIIGKKVVFAKQISSNLPQTSGQLKSHYATKTPLYIGNIEALIASNNNKNIASISLSYLSPNLPKNNQYLLSPQNDITQAAQQLFSVMREIDTHNYDIVIAEIFPNKGLGIAINDRLERARFENKM